MRTIGTSAFGIRAPIFKEGDSLTEIITNSVLNSGIELRDKDVIGITESVVARALGKYVTLDEVSESISELFGPSATIGLIFPIMSRNRFSSILRGICRSASKVIVMFSYPNDEKGNPICDIKKFDELEISTVTFTRKEFERTYGEFIHPFTGVNYFKLYEEVAKSENCEIEFLVSNNPRIMLNFTHNILVCDIHTKERTINRIKYSETPSKVFSLTDVCHNKCEYGLYGSNKTDENRLKLFPDANDCKFIYEVQNNILESTGKKVEVMVYGDGCFHDPVAGIWEFADPVTSPRFTDGLIGTPNELKLKYLADNEVSNLRGDELDSAIKEKISSKNEEIGAMGTTPRRYVDLLASLMDLVSGSGDKGTPVILIQGYFDNYSTE